MTQLLKPEESLSRRVAKGGVWIFSLRIVEKSLGLIRLVILAKLLAPNDFGLFGIALLALSTLETFSQTGFQAALVQKKEDIAKYLDTAWTISVIRGIILFSILFLLAPYVALFFNSPQASLIIKVIGVSILLGGFINIGIIYFQKELEFNKQFVYRLISTLSDFVVAVSAALILKNVWALVFGQLAGTLTGLVVSYLKHPYKPRLSFDFEKARKLFSFGKWISGMSILGFLITKGDDIFVGKFLGVVALGLYQIAYRISSIPTIEITHVISQVTFPAYSKMQDNLPRLREAYLRVLQITAFLSFPIAGLIFVLAPDFTKIFLGEKWMPMVPAMQVLVLWGVIRSLGTTTGQVLVSIGRPEIITKSQFAALILLIILIYPFSIKWGIMGTSLAVLSSTLVPNLVVFFIIIKTIKCGVSNFSKMIALPLINTGFLIFLIPLLRTYWINFDTPGLLLLIILFMILYLCITYLFDRIFNYRFFYNIRMNIQSLKTQ